MAAARLSTSVAATACFFPSSSVTARLRPRGMEPDASLLDPAGPWFDRITTGPLVDDPSERARYGLVVALDVIEHIEHPEPVLALLRARLRPGGWFIATVPAFDELWTSHDDVNHHYRRYRAARPRGRRSCQRPDDRGVTLLLRLAGAREVAGRSQGARDPAGGEASGSAAGSGQHGRAHPDPARTAHRWATATRCSAAPPSWSRARRWGECARRPPETPVRC